MSELPSIKRAKLEDVRDIHSSRETRAALNYMRNRETGQPGSRGVRRAIGQHILSNERSVLEVYYDGIAHETKPLEVELGALLKQITKIRRQIAGFQTLTQNQLRIGVIQTPKESCWAIPRTVWLEKLAELKAKEHTLSCKLPWVVRDGCTCHLCPTWKHHKSLWHCRLERAASTV
jgi:hypothetical protein